MFIRLLLMATLSLTGVSILDAGQNKFDRYNPNQQHHEAANNRNSPIDNEDHQAEDSTDASEEEHAFSSDEIVTQLKPFLADDVTPENHGPLGSICAELAQYCEYFATNMMNNNKQRKEQRSLVLFCHVMELMADLADREFTSVRAETYTSDLIKVITSMRSALRNDVSLQEKSGVFPLLDRILQLEGRTSSDDYTTELGIVLHATLRSSETSQPLVNELFKELKTYAQAKAHILLDMFHEDSRKLLSQSLSPIGFDDSSRAPQKPSTNRHLRQMSWICHHAADACTDLAITLEASPQLKYASPLMEQLNAMLSAMSLTYSHLSSPSIARSHDRHQLANHFASMINLLPKTSPNRSPHSSLEYNYLDKCSALSSPEEKQHFVEDAFSTEFDRDALLDEFFPAFERAVDFNLDNFSSSLAGFTNETLAERFWLHQTPTDK